MDEKYRIKSGYVFVFSIGIVCTAIAFVTENFLQNLLLGLGTNLIVITLVFMIFEYYNAPDNSDMLKGLKKELDDLQKSLQSVNQSSKIEQTGGKVLQNRVNESDAQVSKVLLSDEEKALKGVLSPRKPQKKRPMSRKSS